MSESEGAGRVRMTAGTRRMVDVLQFGRVRDDLVVLLDEARRPIGTALKAEVHTADTPLHLAFSAYLFDADGRFLLTRRAVAKATFPGIWTNSACGHPAPGEDLADAVHRRVGTELGIRIDALSCVLPDFAYRAVDPGGTVENEFCPVFAGTVAGTLAPDPAEVEEWQWINWADMLTAARAAPQLISPWAALQVESLAANSFSPPVPGRSDLFRVSPAAGGR